MKINNTLSIIKNELFHGSAEYTKNQPDLFLRHRYTMLAPSQVDGFLEQVKESLREENEMLIYVHLPFCFSECLFCNTFPHKMDHEIQQEYLQNILDEIDIASRNRFFHNRKVRGIYFGGGTPTSFSSLDLNKILDKIRSCITTTDSFDITSEAHPYTLSGTRIRELADMGITRLSIGCQTFDQQVLSLCKRKNSEEEIRRIVWNVQNAGMSINIDMMTGLPGQTLKSAEHDLHLLEQIRPNAVEYIRHEIVNPLIIDLYKNRPELLLEKDTLFEMVFMTQEWMRDQGYEQNGRFTNDHQWSYRFYWLKELPIFAFGSRARSYTKTMMVDKHEELSTYASMIKKGHLPVGRYISLTKKEQMYRSFFLSLQLQQGLDIPLFKKRFDQDPCVVFEASLAKLTRYECIEQSNETIRLSRYGAYFVEDVCDFIIDSLLHEESLSLVRSPNSEGGRPSPRL
ncbi:MAG: radical SAM protein [Nitrospirota bacterium]